MASSFNTIIPGFPWAQTFRFTAGVFGPGESLKADMRRNIASPSLIEVSDGNGVTNVGNDYTIALTALQTELFAGLPGIIFDLVADGPPERHLGVRVHVPVSASATD